ncbi:MAG TPA: hypothetical protein VJV03_12195, partial [Pyrinomonadaceae bacterium]|nr:hypothetical protein [Pyrinomonadaceae bacterium]
MAKNSLTSSLIYGLFLSILFILNVSTASAQNSSNRGTPAESKPGQSTPSTYARDKIETVNLVNGNFSLAIPIATIGGRGSASFTVVLSYNSKVWTAQHDAEWIPQGDSEFPPIGTVRNYYTAMYEKLEEFEPGLAKLGGGWTIRVTPGIKALTFGIDPAPTTWCNQGTDEVPDCGFKYVLTKMWLSLPDGSQIEMRDQATQGAPARATHITDGYRQLIDRDRGRVWRSVDGSGVIFVRDANYPVGQLTGLHFPSGWIFMTDGTRIRMDEGAGSKMIDRNGNFIDIAMGGQYTDALGRQTTLSFSPNTVAVTVEGYMGTADRTVTINTGAIGDPDNLRADFRTLPRPFTTGDAFTDALGNYSEHTIQAPHTDLFNHSEGIKAYGTSAGVDVGEKTAVTQLNLLDGRSMRFRYNQYGEVSEIVYPGGGVSQIDYLGTATSVCEVSAPIAATLNRRVGQRRTLTDGTNVDATWIYNLNATSVVDGTTYPATLVEIRAGGAAGTLLSSTKHAFLKKGFGSEYRSCFGSYTGTGNEKFGNAREFYTETLTGNGTVVTRRNWVQRAPVVWANDEGLGYNAYINEPSHAQDQPPNDDRITWEDTTLENGKKKRVEYDYDQFNNVTLIKEYDFGNTSGSLGALIRKTYRTYVTNLNNYCYTNLNPADASCGSGLASDVNSIIYQPGLVLTETIKDANDNQKAYSEFEYDNYSSATNHAALVLNSGMIHYDAIRFSTFNNASQPRGNVTKHSRWVGGSNYLHAFNQYDNAGNLVWTKDPNGNVSTISYGDNFGNGTNPDSGLIGPAGATFAMATGVANALNHQSKVQFNYALGSPTGTKDPNLVKTRTEYDSVGRPIRVTAAVGAPAQTIAETTYPTLTANESTTSSQLDTTRWLASKIVFDEFDRPVTSWQSEDGLHASMATFSIRTNTLYDEIGRVTSISNPYRPAQGETALYTTSVYDLMGRVTSVTTPDNSVVQTSYSSNEVTVTDQIGNKRKSVTDALGRLIQIYEAPDQPTFNYLTTYAYDVLDNLVSVSQGGQMRYFMYDPAKRLIRARNPEQDTHASLALSDVQTGNAQWSMGYQYDANGNLTQKTDSRAIISTYGYDALNRNTTINYSNTTTNPDITRSYDGATKGVGRFWQSYAGGTETAGTTVEHLKIHTYDELGRPKDQRQRFRTNSVWGSTEYRVERTYNLAGNVTLQTYPSNRTAAYSYDNAGRASSASGNLGDGTQRTYATGISYVASGAMKQEQFGTTTPIYNKHIYNSRQQLSEIRVGTTPNDTSWNRGAIINHYAACAGACNGTDNNGNLKRQTIYVSTATGSVNWTQTYDYDSLNRLKKVTERDSNTAQLWKQGYTYDRFGNRTIDPLQTSGTGINNKQFTVNTANNRLGVPVGQTGTMTYDPAGNLTADTYSGSAVTRVYDAENRLTSETQGGGLVVGEYNYTADGQRVRRKVNGLETWQVYGMDGELLAEYAAAGASVSPQKEYGYRNGELLVTTEPSTQTVQNVTWTGAAGVTVNGNSLTKTAGTAWGNAGAASTETIASGDGYVEFTATETNTARMCGLSFGNSNTNYTEIDFAMYPTNAGTVSVYEGGVNRGSFGAYTPGTVFRVAVESGVVKYYRNGAVIYTSTVTPTYPLVVDTAMYTVGATLTNVVIGIGSG